jgi:predicted component of type VI protein secretion system
MCFGLMGGSMISIHVVSRAGEPPATPLAARFGPAGGDIGRGTDCTLVLPDPERRISRKHLQVTCQAGRHQLRLLSTNLLVQLDGMPLAPGTEYPLAPGAQVRIGPFVLQVDIADDPTVAARIDDHVAPLLHAREDPVAPSVFDDLLQAPAPEPVDQLDLVVGENASAPAPSEVARDPVADGEAGKLIAALYAGLGRPSPGPQALTPAQLKLVGALLRSTVAGTLGLLASRSIAKRELGASLTVPQMRENNPLKFAPDVDTALDRLLAAPQRGFLGPLESVGAAFDDLRSHEVAVLAGMRAALEAVLARFAPATLEAQLAGGKGVWDNLMPVHRKARLWERYAEQHAQLQQEIEDEFDAILGEAFVKAYEAQRARLAGP